VWSVQGVQGVQACYIREGGLFFDNCRYYLARHVRRGTAHPAQPTRGAALTPHSTLHNCLHTLHTIKHGYPPGTHRARL